MSTVLVTRRAGNVGAVLVPKLLVRGHRVNILDTSTYAHEPLETVRDSRSFTETCADIRDLSAVERCVADCNLDFYLACISNDPSFELDPQLRKSINYDSFAPLLVAAGRAGVRRLIYISSSRLYGSSDAQDVTKNHPLPPLADYSWFKALYEPILHAERGDSFETLVIRPATVYGS